MRILGIDTSTERLVVGIYDGAKVYGYSLILGRRMDELLASHIQRILNTLSLKAQDFDYFACGVGPGSFTGIRIGVAFIKGLAWGAKKKVLGIGSLDMLAFSAQVDGRLVAIKDARRGLLYCAVFQRKGGIIRRSRGPRLLSLEELLLFCGGRPIFLGDGLSLYQKEIMLKVRGARFLDSDYWQIRPEAIINLALAKLKQKKAEDASSLQAVYLYPAACQVRKP